MTKYVWSVLLLCLAIASPLWAQENDPVLFSVEGDPVHVSEFKYIYSKTNGDKADFSRESLDEYLDLYTKFKLKVQKVKQMKLDTIEQLKKELAGYRRQLADSYLVDKEVTEKLIREAYERVKKDVNISHILFKINGEGATDTLSAYNRALEIKRRLGSGEAFAEMAKQYSDDPSAARNGGNLGFITAILPNGFYPLETAAYSLPQGKVGGPVRTQLGYHLVVVNEERPARGEIEVAHILLRKKEGADAAVLKQRMESIYQKLKDGTEFDQLARENSEDRMSAPQGGYIGFFGINRYERTFEDVAFSLQEDGQISKPFESSVGWHLIKRISKRDIQPYEVEKSRLENKIKSDGRFEQAKVAMIKRIQAEGQFTESPDVLSSFIKMQTDTFLTFRWRPPSPRPEGMLFKLGGNDYTLGGFIDYVTGEASRKRLSMGQTVAVDKAIQTLYEDFINASCLKFEERKLEEKYPDFKNLMREYEEGILLFEATKMLVWDKASQDTVGLRKYFDKNKGLYRWDERAKMSYYRVGKEGHDQIEAIRTFGRNAQP